MTNKGKIRNIRAEEPDRITWDASAPAKSLQNLRDVVEAEGQKAIDWYWSAKRWKRIPSQGIQFCALLLTAAAGIVPIVFQIVKSAVKGTGWISTFDSGPLASLFVGMAAALLGLDKAFGYSTGWTRYVLTATRMTTLLQEFRMDWIALMAANGAPPSAVDQAAMIQRAKDFIHVIQGLVEQETKDWATEFQSNIGQMEKDLKVQLDFLKAQVDKNFKDKQASSQPGAVEMTVANAEKTDTFSFDLIVEGPSGRFIESVANSQVWTRINIAPGQYKVTINAKSKGNVISTSTIVNVNPGEIQKFAVTLPIQ